MLFTDSDRLVDRMPDVSVFPFFEPTPSEAEAWAKQLELTSIDHRMDALLEASEGLGLYQCTSQLRFQILETLLPLALETIRLHSRHYDRKSASPSMRANLAFESIHALLSNLITGYCLCATEDVTSFFTGENLRLKSLFRASMLCSRKLLEALLMYAGDEQPWEIFHRIVRFSRRFGESETAVNLNTPHTAWSGRSIEDIYRSSLLLSLCYPYQLTQPQIRQLTRFCRVLSFHLEECDPNDESCAFVIRPYDHSSPTPASLVPKLERAGYWGYTAIEFIDLINSQSKAIPSEWFALDTKVRRLVFKALANPPYRSEHREACNESAVFVIGLSRMHRLISNSPEPLILDKVQSLAESSQQVISGHVIDTSDSGMQLQWKVTTDKPPRIQVGDIIGVFNALPIQVGIIRWLKKSSSQIIRIGLQIIGEQPSGFQIENHETEEPVVSLMVKSPAVGRTSSKVIFSAQAPSPIELLSGSQPPLGGIEQMHYLSESERTSLIRVYNVSFLQDEDLEG